MFKCVHCGGSRVKRASVTAIGHKAVCASCKTVNVIEASDSVLDTDTLTQKPEALVFVEPEYEEEEVVKFPWLETTPEEQFEEMREELNIPPEVEIPPPGPGVATMFPERELEVGEYPQQHEEHFYRNNMSRLWWNAWNQMGDVLGDETFDEFAYPILMQFADTPELVKDLFTPHGGSRLQGQFLNAVKENMYQYLLDRGVDITIGGGRPGEVVLEYLKAPELTDHVYDITFQSDHPDYLGPIPEHKMDPRNPRKSLEIPYIANLVMKVREWEENQ